MAQQMDKAGLWSVIRTQHPAFAQALKASKANGDEVVAINGYGENTDGWLMSALDCEHPDLATLLRGMEVFATIGRPVAEMAISDLIAALLAFEGRQEAA